MTTSPLGQAATIRKAFSRETSIEIDIHAAPEAIWTLLTHAAGYPKWNSTVIALEGEIAQGQRIKLTATLDPQRVFSLKVQECTPPRRLVWGDAMGQRTYTLTEAGPGKTRFAMREKIGGPLFPLFAGMIPPFDRAFEQFAADLKAAAEAAAPH